MRDARQGRCAMQGTADSRLMAGKLGEASPEICARQGRTVALDKCGRCARQFRAHARGNAGHMRKGRQGICGSQGGADSRVKAEQIRDARQGKFAG
jgi:hypothetical protein